MNFVQIIMLALFFLPEAPIFYAPMLAPPKQQKQTIGLPENQNTIATQPTAIADLTGATTSVKPAIAQCSPDEFKSFFEQFVRNPSTGYAYIDSEVQIRDYQDPSMLLMTIGDKNYVDFRIWAIGNRYVYLDPSAKYRGDDELLKKRLKLDYQRIDAKTFRVNYIRAEFINDGKDRDGTLVRTYGEPEAYIFEHRHGCWHLTQSLRQYRAWKELQTNKLFTPLIRGYGGRVAFIGRDDATYSHDLIVTAYTDLLYYKKLDAQFGYTESDKRDRWREWNVIHEAVTKELMRFYSTLQCLTKELAVVPRFEDYDDSSGTYGSQSLDRIATAIAEYHALQADLHLSPEAAKDRWLEIRKKISIDTNVACVIAGG
ncbi:hypothetical protein APA_337 [Pseudanabaena sp. lw0831]|uniref:hypothetical protein n=1 Tax=Pseudanabaena sp. lw0831 TaxID=1357935 RepID=UPI0019150DA8|nr:hypothetical protein [Pseudanabaena sp. lw0831]GBO52668.1 hypothetical protein APA_337 [Pseudanabaena sp. lw0831]